MNEHEFQTLLVQRWLHPGIEMADGERVLLAAWEVMANWEINNQLLGRWQPSIDFVGLDADCKLVAIELKQPIVSAPRDVWAQLCQVTIRAVGLGRTYRPDRLRHVHDECLSGRHGRVDPHSASIDQRFEQLFGEPLSLPPAAGPVRRVIAAPAFGPSVAAIVDDFERKTFSETTASLRDRFSTQSGPLAKEVPRLEELADADICHVGARVESLVVTPGAE